MTAPAHHDVFISYNSADAEFARSLAMELDSLGIRVWLDFDEVLPGDDFQDALQRAIRSVNAVVVLFGGRGVGPWEQVEMRAALAESVKRRLTIIPVVVPGADPEPDLPLFLEPFSKLDLRAGITADSLRRLSDAIRQAAARTTARSPTSVRDVLSSARHWVVLSGFDLQRLFASTGLQLALLSVLDRGVRVTLIQLNPRSAHAVAQLPVDPIEPTLPALDEVLDFLRNAKRTGNLEVLFVSYSPKPPTIVCDQSVFVYLQMSDPWIADEPDVVLRDNGGYETEPRRRRLHNAVLAPIESPDVNPFIRYGQIYEWFADSKIAAWEQWSPAERRRRSLTHEFYVRYASDFHARFGWDIEREVAAHLDHLHGSCLVLGCGSGKELDHLARRDGDAEIHGVDLSPIAIGIARKRMHHQRNCHLTVGDFYDLDYLYPATFDNVVANATFVHLLQRDDIDEMLEQVHRRLRPGGLFFLRCLFKERADGLPIPEEFHFGNADRWNAERWFVYYSRTELADRLQRAGFDVRHDVTDRIARRESGFTRAWLETVRHKGFPHMKFSHVFWPTLLARKPG
jgi:SAM-dependent methyltransferase